MNMLIIIIITEVQATVGQAPLPTPPPPPEGFSSYGSGRAKGGVIGLSGKRKGGGMKKGVKTSHD